MLVFPTMDPTLRARHPSSLPQVVLRHIAHATTRLSYLFVKTVGVALAMLLIPRMLHVGVQCFDELYEVLGRRARSPWEPRMLGGHGVVAGIVVMLVLHVALWRVCYGVILDEGEGPRVRVRVGKEDSSQKIEEGTSWERVLVRVIIPVLMFGGLLLMVWKLWGMSGQTGREYVKANTVDITDDARAQLMWRDR